MPFKTFVNGAVLPASDVNTYLMKQSVMVFADETARDDALTTPTEGMVAYLQNANKVTIYDGSVWRVIDLTNQTYTPTWTNVTVGTSPTIVTRYHQIGRWVFGLVALTLGTGGSVSGLIGISTPTPLSGTSASGLGESVIAGTTYITNWRSSTNRFDVYAQNASGTYVTRTATSGTIPGTYAAGSTITIWFAYETTA